MRGGRWARIINQIKQTRSGEPPMSDSIEQPAAVPTDGGPEAGPGVTSPAPPLVQEQVVEIASLLKALDEDATETGRTVRSVRSVHENRLVQVRLGIASSLYTALRSKHAPTAAHALRVALGCSCFALEMDLPDEVCDVVEMAALLHDIGKIGIPDRILQKPGRLTSDEVTIMDRHIRIGLEILESCCASQPVLDAVQ